MGRAGRRLLEEVDALLQPLDGQPGAEREAAFRYSQSRFRNTLWTLLVLIVVSGLYNFFTYAGPRHSSTYQIWFGIKMLVVLHILTTAILWGTSSSENAAKASRRLTGLTITGVIVVLISAYLRSLSQRGL